MANEIRVSTKFDLLRDNVNTRNVPLRQVSIATTSELYSDNTQIVGTTHEVLVAGDVTDDALLIVENLHATATVEIGIDDSGSFVSVITIPPGYPPAVIPVASSLAATYLESDTASTPVRVTLVKIVA